MSYDPNNSRKRKVYTALEGQDEFSVMSVEPDLHQLKVELEAQRQASQGRPESAPQSGLLMRVFGKLFRG